MKTKVVQSYFIFLLHGKDNSAWNSWRDKKNEQVEEIWKDKIYFSTNLSFATLQRAAEDKSKWRKNNLKVNSGAPKIDMVKWQKWSDRI